MADRGSGQAPGAGCGGSDKGRDVASTDVGGLCSCGSPGWRLLPQLVARAAACSVPGLAVDADAAPTATAVATTAVGADVAPAATGGLCRAPAAGGECGYCCGWWPLRLRLLRSAAELRLRLRLRLQWLIPLATARMRRLPTTTDGYRRLRLLLCLAAPATGDGCDCGSCRCSYDCGYQCYSLCGYGRLLLWLAARDGCGRGGDHIE